MAKRIFLTTILFLSAAVFLFAVDWAAIVEEYGQAVAKITVTDDKGAVISQGSGFMIETVSGNQRMVTNAHVVAAAEHSEDVSLSAEFSFSGDNINENLTIDKINREQDLCLLKLSIDAPAVLRLSENEKPGLMEEILVIGYPLGRSFKTTPGYIQAFQNVEGMGRMLDLSAVVAPGNSGGPVLDGDGHVIGIITAVIPGYNFNLAIPVGNLLSVFLNKNKQFDLIINSDPDGAWVFINGEYKGKTPLTQELFNREYNLRIEKKGLEIIDEKIGPWEVPPENIDLSLQKEINDNPVIEISVDPLKADVSINNKDLGKAPVSVQFPAGSILRIRLSAAGYNEKLEFYEVTEELNQQVEIELRKKFLLW
ncbi:MAG TPA: hypothetical protein DCO79_07690 [Spirochaeta sp.]|nr:hypothetical protein [Spirochaeta sp.]